MLEGYTTLNKSLEICNTTQECQSVTMGENGEFFTQDSMERFYSQGSYFFVKRSLMTSMNLPYFTTTQTSTVTSSPTSTVTSSPTSTVTSSPTSTVTSSATSTMTSSATSTMTSSATPVL